MISRERMLNVLCKLIGKKNTTRLQSQLKYILNFRTTYSGTSSDPMRDGENPGKTYIFMVDGKTAHGGLSDRMRGCFSIYDYCKSRGYKFKIYWRYPDDLRNYFLPANVDWEISDEEMVFDRSLVDFKFFNTYTMLQDDSRTYASLLDSKKTIVHVYSNLTMNEENYESDFSDLFKSSDELQKQVDRCLEKMNSGYISITFRFIGCLGDFQDRPDLYPPLKTETEKNEYINSCIEKIKELKQRHQEVDIVLVTSDSRTFLNEAAKLEYVYIVPGTVTHMDVTSNRTELSQMKSFLDFLLISKAQVSYTYAYGKMFKGSKFAKTAALISGRNVIDLDEG